MNLKDYASGIKLRIKILLIFFIVSLVLSGLTAFPLETELKWLSAFCTKGTSWACHWIYECYYAVKTTNEQFPFLSYGTDWLAFSHVVIAVAFIGPLVNPVRNIWVIQFGMIACIMVFPLALIAGHFREIPLLWRLIDCSFGVIGFIPLWLCYRYIRKLEIIQTI